MKKYTKILIGLAVVLLLANVVYLGVKFQASLQPTFSEEAMKKHPLFKKAQDELVTDVQAKGLQQLTAENFALGPTEEAAVVFENFFENVRSTDVFRIKVWDKNYRVIWSNSTELIGKSFPDNHEVEEALAGEVEAEVKKGKAEQYSERSFTNFGEFYVPIKDASGKVIGVVEVYKVTEELVNSLRSEFYQSALISFGISAVLFIIAAVGLKAAIR